MFRNLKQLPKNETKIDQPSDKGVEKEFDLTQLRAEISEIMNNSVQFAKNRHDFMFYCNYKSAEK